MRWLQRLRPRRIGGQIALVLAAAVVASHLLVSAVFWQLLPRPPAFGPPGLNVEAARLATVVKIADAALPQERPGLLAAASDSRLLISAGGSPEPEAPGAALSAPVGALLAAVRPRLPPEVPLVARLRPDGVSEFWARLRDGAWISAHLLPGPSWAEPKPPPPPALGTLIPLVIFMTVILLGASLWVSRRLTLPLRRFADAVDRASPDGRGLPLVPDGPLEVRQASEAFNRLSERVRQAMLERVRSLAAISHDLRTPLTRLRLRIEGLSEAPDRAELLRDVGRMERLLDSALSYLRGQAVDEPIEAVDLPSLIETVLDRYQELGHQVGYEGPDHLVWRCRPLGLDRAVSNLVENAAEFGHHIRVRLLPMVREGVRIEVEDDGPGIPEAEKARVLEPFHRGDAERDPGRPGFGLGLAIVADIVAAHGGRIELADAEPNGLLVRISLPRLA